jgi:hypothetical protein
MATQKFAAEAILAAKLCKFLGRRDIWEDISGAELTAP